MNKLSHQVIIIAMLILPATTILATPLTNTYFPPVFGQALLPEGTGVGAFGFGPVPSSSPFDLCWFGVAGEWTNWLVHFPPISAPHWNFLRYRYQLFHLQTSFAPGLTPAF